MVSSLPVLLLLFSTAPAINALDNGLRLPPMGWSSWYGFTSHIDEEIIRDMSSGMVTSGLAAVGYEHIWLDDGWIIDRDNRTGRPIEDPARFPSGMGNLSAYVHSLGLKFGIYTSKGPLTCLGMQDDQPNRPGSCGHERIDANVYANEWHVDEVKDDGCGQCPQYDPFVAMAVALNRTGRQIWFSIHPPGGNPNPKYARIANSWRTGDDLWGSSYQLWNDRLDLATADAQAALSGPGTLPNPDFLEVGYSPRYPKSRKDVMTPLEQRSMFTMWAALPAPLILSADLRPGAACGGLDADALETLTNREVIEVNQDKAVKPMRPVKRGEGLEVWRKPLSKPGKVAVVLFHRGNSTVGPMPNPPLSKVVRVTWDELGYGDKEEVAVRDLWRHRDLGIYTESFGITVREREALIFTFTVLSKKFPSQGKKYGSLSTHSSTMQHL